MTELKNVEVELGRFRGRVFLATGFVVFAFVLLLARLVYLQVLRYDDLMDQAEGNRTAAVPIVPNRGEILDRNGIALATNYSAYTLEITPSKSLNLEATVDELAKLVEITPRDRKRFKKLLEESKSFETIPIRTRLSDVEVARFAAQRFRFPGVEVKARLFRQYPYGALASHVLGYIGRVNPTEKARIEESDTAENYRGTEYVGKLGIEQSYENRLHGVTGMEEIETSASGKAVRKLASSPATPGDTVILSLDIRLQKMIEDLFGNRRGALVAIDPRNGEVLAFVSKPTFDPNLFVEGIDPENWDLLNTSIDKPLLNRALRGTYPPGSTYKPFMALGALELGKRSAGSVIYDPGFWMLGEHRFRSHGDEALGSVDLYKSIVKSSNTYYYSLANEMGVDAMHDFMKPLGFGQLSGIDIQGEVRGVLPSQEWKRNEFKKKRPEQRRWFAGDTISLGIGQGYNAFTILQLAQATATLASGGVRHTPKLVSHVQDAVTRQKTALTSAQALNLNYKPEHIAQVRKGLVGVTLEGTSARVFAGAQYVSAGKTGTAQAVGIGQQDKYEAAKLAEHQRDHSLYMAYAPADSPQIALAVIVENSGFGAEHAAPIARRVFDFVLMGNYPSEDDIAAARKGQASSPLGTVRKVKDLDWANFLKPEPAAPKSKDAAVVGNAAMPNTIAPANSPLSTAASTAAR